jgi:hypothetical protein
MDLRCRKQKPGFVNNNKRSLNQLKAFNKMIFLTKYLYYRCTLLKIKNENKTLSNSKAIIDTQKKLKRIALPML